MKKVNIGLVLAGLFSAGVMIYLLVAGVTLRERQMIKWSAVDSTVHAAQPVARFVFPILNEFEVVQIDNSTNFGKDFFATFVATAQQNTLRAQIAPLSEGEASERKTFRLHMRELNESSLREKCARQERIGCVGVKALRHFKKKPRDPAKLWINLYRLDAQNGVLYYIPSGVGAGTLENHQ